LRDVEVPTGEHAHDEVKQMQHRASQDLLRHIECPDLERAARALTIPLPDERGDGEDTQCTLNEQRKGAEEFALAVVVVRILWSLLRPLPSRGNSMRLRLSTGLALTRPRLVLRRLPIHLNVCLDLLLLHPLDPKQLRLKHQRSTTWYPAHAPVSVCHLRWDREVPLLAYAHAHEPDIPAFDYLPSA
jgi:hypothetical protein